MATVRFESVESTLVIHNPLNGFAPEQQRVEVRSDPLLGGTSVLNRFLSSKTGFSGVNDRAFISRLAEESAKGCVFCGVSLRERTARYPDELVPGGRLFRGEATLLPNLFALGAYHPVVVLSRAHYLELAGFTPPLITDGFGVSREFLRSVRERSPAAPYAALGANYLPPAGASQVHPHLQLLATPAAYTRQERLLSACRSHHERHGSSLLVDLAREEQRLGQRYVAQLRGWHWVAAYAPQGCNELLAIHETEQDLAALGDDDLLALAAGISKVLGFYDRLGLLSYNYLLLSARRGEETAGFRLLLRIISRQNLSPAYRNDDYFLQKLLDADVIVTPPEELARGLRAAF